MIPILTPKLLLHWILTGFAFFPQGIPFPGPGRAPTGAPSTPDAVIFDGTNDYLVNSAMGTAPFASSAGPFTVALWFKATNLTQTNKYVIMSGTAGSGWSILWEFVNNQLEFFSVGHSGTAPRTSSGITLGDTDWHHIAYRKGASGASTWDKFLDGTKTSINASIDFTLSAPAAAFTIGSTGSANWTAGGIAQVILVSDALSDGDISGLHSACTDPTTLGLGANLIGYWKLRGASPEVDSSGAGHNLTVSGAPVTIPGPAACTS